ncbi:hypothetical protein DFA_00161 [Cavenderia fasciculata]|uniref:Uncharacterized protein n=1 Tax=Cavenderia fasciculata TaxID=261658 RepID=F4PXS3_CACFS|nr:uncharacterized protein DFA_00161 [Cavenderia fasciculata]EGG19583.1 hypothetical protein DFA_00161 [Cavenderia fasciculata]|eukprot:XP_004357877.1 hypothetical protein DFA_00161 [Cavenderia fasciculata]
MNQVGDSREYCKRLVYIPGYVQGIMVNLVIRDCIIEDDTTLIVPLASVNKRWFDIVKAVLQSQSTDLKKNFGVPANLSYGQSYSLNWSPQFIHWEMTSFLALPIKDTIPNDPILERKYSCQQSIVGIANEHLCIEHPFYRETTPGLSPTGDIVQVLLDTDKVSPKLENLKSLKFRSVYPKDSDQCIKLFQQCQAVESVELSDNFGHTSHGFISSLSSLPRLSKLSMNRFGLFTETLPNTITSISVESARYDTLLEDFKEYVLNAKQLKSLEVLVLDREWTFIVGQSTLTKLGLEIRGNIRPIFSLTLEYLMIDYSFGNVDLRTLDLEKLPSLRKLAIKGIRDCCDYLIHFI